MNEKPIHVYTLNSGSSDTLKETVERLLPLHDAFKIVLDDTTMNQLKDCHNDMHPLDCVIEVKNSIKKIAQYFGGHGFYMAKNVSNARPLIEPFHFNSNGDEILSSITYHSTVETDRTTFMNLRSESDGWTWTDATCERSFFEENFDDFPYDWNFKSIHSDNMIKYPPQRFYQSSNALTPLTVEAFELPKLNILLPSSGPKHWRIYPFAQQLRLNAAITSYREEKCVSTLLHNTWALDDEAVEEIRLKSIVTTQMPGEIIVIGSGCCYQTFAPHPTVFEECLFYCKKVVTNSMQRIRCSCTPVIEQVLDSRHSDIRTTINSINILNKEVFHGKQEDSTLKSFKNNLDTIEELGVFSTIANSEVELNAQTEGQQPANLDDDDDDDDDDNDGDDRNSDAESDGEVAVQQPLQQPLQHPLQNPYLNNSAQEDNLQGQPRQQDSDIEILNDEQQLSTSRAPRRSTPPASSKKSKRKSDPPADASVKKKKRWSKKIARINDRDPADEVINTLQRRVRQNSAIRNASQESKRRRAERDTPGRKRECKDPGAIFFKREVENVQRRLTRIFADLTRHADQSIKEKPNRSIEQLNTQQLTDTGIKDDLEKDRDRYNILRQIYCLNKGILNANYVAGISPTENIRLFFDHTSTTNQRIWNLAVENAIKDIDDQEFYKNLITDEDAWNHHFDVMHGINIPWQKWIEEMNLNADDNGDSSKAILEALENAEFERNSPFQSMHPRNDDNVQLVDEVDTTALHNNHRSTNFDDTNNNIFMDHDDVVSHSQNALHQSSASKEESEFERVVRAHMDEEAEEQQPQHEESSGDSDVSQGNQNVEDAEQEYVKNTLKLFDDKNTILKMIGNRLSNPDELQCLEPDQFLSPTVVNEYFRLLGIQSSMENGSIKCLFGTTHCSDSGYTDISAYQNIQDISAYSHFIVPINYMDRYILFVVNFSDSVYHLYDSTSSISQMKINLLHVQDYISLIWSYHGRSMDWSKIKEHRPVGIYHNFSPESSGVITCTFAKQILLGEKHLSIGNDTFARQLLMCEILTGRLYHHNAPSHQSSFNI